MTGGTIFFIIWLILAVFILTRLYVEGKKALSIFPDIGLVKIIFRDRTASGYSSKNWRTKIGGASNTLDVVVTDNELWTRSMILFAGIGQRYDLVHRIPLKKLVNVGDEGRQVRIEFSTDDGELKQIFVSTKDNAALIASLRMER